jgi:hypothetical protein
MHPSPQSLHELKSFWELIMELLFQASKSSTAGAFSGTSLTSHLLGVSYVTTDKSGLDDISVIVSWDGGGTSWKTPTRIAYAIENPRLQRNKWGFQVDSRLISYSWTKLLLDKSASVGEYDDPSLSKIAGTGILQLPPFRDAPGVCEDFLREMYTHVSDKLCTEFTKDTFETMPMECWITLPAIWSDEAKDATLAAAKKAGFGNRVGDEVFTIAEPEAAALTTLKGYAGPNSPNPVRVSQDAILTTFLEINEVTSRRKSFSSVTAVVVLLT